MSEIRKNNYDTKWGQRMHKSWTKELTSSEYNITGTLMFNDGTRVSRTLSFKLLKAFWHKLDRIFFGHAAKKGVGIQRWVFVEYGKSGENLHYHFKAISPIDASLFCCIANYLWSNFHTQTAQMQYNEITPTQMPVFSAQYVTKETKHLGYDEAGLAASHCNNPAIDIRTFQTQAQANRIANQISIDNIEKAKHVLVEHIKTVEDRILRRHRYSRCARRTADSKTFYNPTC